MKAVKRKERRAWETFCRRAVHDAVIALLSRDGIEGLTMEKVAVAAGVAKGTLYLYYRNKEELLHNVRQDCLNPMRQELIEVLDGDGPPRARLGEMVLRHLRYFDENRDLFRVSLWERQLPGGRTARRQSTTFVALVKKVAEVLEEGMRAGAFRPLSPGKLAAMLVESDIAVISHRLHDETPVPVEQDAQMVLDIFLNGLETRRRSVARQP